MGDGGLGTKYNDISLSSIFGLYKTRSLASTSVPSREEGVFISVNYTVTVH